MDYLSKPIQAIKINNWMKKAPTLSKSDMDAITIKALRDICIYANEHIPFYKSWFKEANFIPEQMNDFEYFERLPILTKDIVRANYESMVSDEAKQLGAVECETSGSTGTPLHFMLDNNINTASLILFYRTWKMCKSWRPFKWQATISGYAEGKSNENKLTKILYLSSFYLSDETIKEFYDLIVEHNVKFIRGYPSSLYRFAQLIEKHNLKLHFDTMFSGAETLLPYQREYIEKTFGGKIIDHYTHWERVASICNCSRGNLHAQNDYGYHEILNEDGKAIKDGVGKLVCTGLYNKAMPLIRYDTRDLAEWDTTTKCDCGSNFPIVKRIIGRIEDIVITPDGLLVGRLDAAFKYNKNIKMSYIYQPSVEKIIVNLCPYEGYDIQDQIEVLNTELRKRVGNVIKIEYKKVTEAEIPYTPAGKVRFVVSDVNKKLQTTNLAEML